MVQSKLHPEDERPEEFGDSSESHANETTQGVFESLSPDAMHVNTVSRRSVILRRVSDEVVTWIKTFASAAIYATLIVTFGFQVARVEGKSMEPTLQDQDRLIVNKAAYRFFGDPEPGDIVML